MSNKLEEWRRLAEGNPQITTTHDIRRVKKSWLADEMAPALNAACDRIEELENLYLLERSSHFGTQMANAKEDARLRACCESLETKLKAAEELINLAQQPMPGSGPGDAEDDDFENDYLINVSELCKFWAAMAEYRTK